MTSRPRAAEKSPPGITILRTYSARAAGPLLHVGVVSGCVHMCVWQHVLPLDAWMGACTRMCVTLCAAATCTVHCLDPVLVVIDGTDVRVHAGLACRLLGRYGRNRGYRFPLTLCRLIQQPGSKTRFQMSTTLSTGVEYCHPVLYLLKPLPSRVGSRIKSGSDWTDNQSIVSLFRE